MKPSIAKSTLTFLKNLDKNNEQEWFTEHKADYTAALDNVSAFADALIAEMNKHDELDNTSGRKSIYRIYSDARFDKNKPPYRPRFAFSLIRSTKLRRGGYYVHIKPGNTYMACGFFSPNPEDLKRIRQDIEMNYDVWQKLLKSKGIKDNFGEMQGDKVVTAPKGFAKDHEAIDLLRHKAFVFRHHFTDAEMLSPDFLKEVNRLFKAMRPWLNYMSEVLTTDLNGESILFLHTKVESNI